MTSDHARSRWRVLLTEPIHESGLRLLRETPNLELIEPSSLDEESLAFAARDVDAIAVRSARITETVIESASRLRVVARHGVGYDNIDAKALSARRIPLALAVHANAVSVAEHTLYFLLALAKNGPRYDRAARQGDFGFRNSLEAFDVEGKTLLVVGFGRIGSRVTTRAHAFGLEVLAYDPYVDPTLIEGAGAQPLPALEAGLGRADFVSLHCPLTEETRDLIDAKALGRMRKGAFLINCARGGIVDEDALLSALEAGQLAGAALDVFSREPLEPHHPLLSMEQVLVSPHSAGVSREGATRMSRETAQNVLDALRGQLNPESVANREACGLGTGREMRRERCAGP